MSDTKAAGVDRMKFIGYSDEKFSNEIVSYTVKINPESFERSLGATVTLGDKTPKSSGDRESGLTSETLSFDLVFDGTGVLDHYPEKGDLNKYFKAFLKAVYYHEGEDDQQTDPSGGDATGGSDSSESNTETTVTKTKKILNYVKITYCKESFYTQLSSMSIKYLLFHKDGFPLRIKASCRFSTVEGPKPEGKEEEGGGAASGSEAPPVKKDSPNKVCVNVCQTLEKTIDAARENDSVSILTCMYKMTEMTPDDSAPVDEDSDEAQAREMIEKILETAQDIQKDLKEDSKEDSKKDSKDDSKKDSKTDKKQ